VAKRKGNGEIF